MIAASLRVDCLNCDRRMVPHDLVFVCLKCEARVEVNETGNLVRVNDL